MGAAKAKLAILSLVDDLDGGVCGLLMLSLVFGSSIVP